MDSNKGTQIVEKKANPRRAEKKFVCDVSDCHRSFTRRDHLSRHQLNHNPNHIYRCYIAGCSKAFVRKDLYNRHIERHIVFNETIKSDNNNPDGANILQEQVKHDTPQSPKTLPSLPLVKPQNRSNSWASSLASPPTTAFTTKVVFNEESFHDSEDYIPAQHISPDNTNMSEVSPSSNQDLTDWLFTPGLGLLSTRMGVLEPYSFLLSPLRDFSQMSSPPSFEQNMVISENKRQELMQEIPQLQQFEEFSLPNVCRYNELYWERFHFQCPILHHPSFQVDATPFPLLLSIILIGSSYASTSEEFKTTIATPLRWIIFKSSSFHPPTRVWVLQSLLLLEIYEKTRSESRSIHERAHIHHGTTLQLIRRGSTLMDPSIKLDPENSSTWLEWIEAESIKRAVFLAFVLDVSHSVLFSHSKLLHPNELQLSLPCDDRVWDSADDNRHLLNKPTVPFINGLRSLLKGNHMQVNSELGRLALLYGLLSHYIQISNLDLEASTLDSEIIIPFRDKWGIAISNALDFWWKDYDKSTTMNEEDIISEWQLNKLDYLQHYHYAYISMRLRRYELHVFCGDRRVLGKTTIREDYLFAEKYMYDWSKTLVAKEAAFHALKALSSIFLKDGKPTMYSVSNDPFVHRPMMIAHCALVFWSYSFCLDGPESKVLARRVENDNDLEDYEWALVAESGLVFLERCSYIRKPSDLDGLENKQRTVGLLKWVILALSNSNWPLLKEVCQMMDNCVKRSLGWEGTFDNELEIRNIQVG